MKSSLIVLGCFALGLAACSAPQGKKLASTNGLAPVATGPISPATKSASLTGAQAGQMVSVLPGGTVTVTLDADDQDGYSWRLAEIPDPTVLKLVSQEYIPPATTGARGQEKWVFQSTGLGDVDVRMWYGDLRNSPLGGKETFDFITSVVNEPARQPTKHSKKSRKVSPDHTA
jgi:predicted secreted protein